MSVESRELIIDVLEEVWRQDTVAVEEDEVFALAMLSTEVARLAWATVLLGVVTKWQFAGIAMYNAVTRQARTILHNDDLHVAKRLLRYALEQFIHLIGTVIYGNYD